MIVEGTLDILCEKCKKVNTVDSYDTEFELSSSDDDRGMGSENQYTWSSSFPCENCDNEIEIEYDVWEYPEGAYNSEECNISGGKTNDRFIFNFID